MQDILRLIIPIVVIYGIVMAATVFVIRRLLLSDTMRAVERINQVEVEVRRREEALRKEIEEREKEIAQRKAQAEEEVQRQKEQIAKIFSQLKEKTIADARREGERILEQARRNEEKIRQQLMAEVQQKTADQAAQVVGLVFSEKVTAQIDQAFVGELLDALAEIDASAIAVDTASAEFTAAHPLTPEQRQRLQSLLAEKFGVSIPVQEKVQESLLAGLVLKLGSLEIDGSLLNRFKEAAEEIKKSASG